MTKYIQLQWSLLLLVHHDRNTITLLYGAYALVVWSLHCSDPSPDFPGNSCRRQIIFPQNIGFLRVLRLQCPCKCPILTFLWIFFLLLMTSCTAFLLQPPASLSWPPSHNTIQHCSATSSCCCCCWTHKSPYCHGAAPSLIQLDGGKVWHAGWSVVVSTIKKSDS